MSAPETERLLADRYRLRAEIGRGGMGAVWRARDEMLNRDVAVKEIIWPPGMDEAERDTVRRRAVREAQMLARLRHPNVVGVYDIFEEDGRPAIVMELVPFRSLRDTVRDDGPLPPTRVARIGLGVLTGLRAAHQAGVVHRDVKPDNILLGPEDRIVLTDFGIAKAVDSPALTTSGILIGSPSYLAPERARGGPGDAAADLWGLGASLYWAAEGRPPFERPGVLASLTAVVAEEPEPPLHAGPLTPVINGLLRKDPGTRLGAADAERMLRDILDQDTAVRTGPAIGPTVALGPAADTGPAPAAEPAPPAPEADTESFPPVAEAQAPAAAAVPDAAGSPPDAAGSPDKAAAPVPHGPPPVRRRRPRRARGLWAALIAVVAIAAITTAVTWDASGTGHPKATTSARSSVPASASASAPGSGASTPPPATSAPASSPGASGGAASAVPSGYYRFTNSTGFSIGVPAGWQIQHVGHYVYIRDPANSGIFLLIDQSDQPKSDPLADWREQAAARQSSYPGYRLIRLAAVSYPQAEKAADWQFTYDRDGVEVEVLNRNVLANAQHAYALYWSTPVSDWNAYYHYFQVFAATFQPAP